MKNGATIKIQKHRKKAGVALVITLGFLAILTIIAVAFAMQMRLERLAGRGVLSTAQTRHLLDTALSRAMADIDFTVGDKMYPPQNSMASGQSLAVQNFRTYTHQDGTKLSDTMDLTVIPRNDPGDAGEESLGFSDTEFIPTGWIWGSSDANLSEIYYDFCDAFDDAEWQDVLDADDKIVGRVGYFIVNMSGLLDANYVGGYTNQSSPGYIPRANGRTPAEIQLSRYILTEFNQSGNGNILPLLSATSADAIVADQLQITNDLSAALAMVYNRTNAWNRFETVRDFWRLNQLGNYMGVDDSTGEDKLKSSNIVRNRPKNFFTFSYSPPDDRLYMGRTEADLNEANVLTALTQIGIDADNADFVVNQLRDYVDEDFDPVDVDYSVEPVPLINEIGLESDFKVTMKIVSSAPVFTLEGNHELTVEAWYPFAAVTNFNDYSINFSGVINLPPGTEDLFGSLASPGNLDLDDGPDNPWPGGDRFRQVTESWKSEDVEYHSVGELLAGFAALNGAVIDMGEITMDGGSGMVDRVQNIEIELDEGNLDTFETELNNLSEGGEATNHLEFGLAVVDPRLNWDASDAAQWISVGDVPAAPDSPVTPPLTLGDRNIEVSDSTGTTVDKKNILYVRNDNRIDSPYEFTYFLYDTAKPWQTFQFFEDNDPDDTRQIVDQLHTYPNGPPRHGRVNPNSQNENVLASVFYRLPIDTFAQDFDDYIPSQRIPKDQALTIGQLLMNERLYENRSDFGKITYNNTLFSMLGTDFNPNPWKMESILRNSAELFEPRNNTFAVFLVAQQVVDADEDGTITEEEVQLTQRAIAYVWREPGPDPVFGSSCVFYQRSESLGVFGVGENKGIILDAFKPDD